MNIQYISTLLLSMVLMMFCGTSAGKINCPEISVVEPMWYCHDQFSMILTAPFPYKSVSFKPDAPYQYSNVADQMTVYVNPNVNYTLTYQYSDECNVTTTYFQKTGVDLEILSLAKCAYGGSVVNLTNLGDVGAPWNIEVFPALYNGPSPIDSLPATIYSMGLFTATYRAYQSESPACPVVKPIIPTDLSDVPLYQVSHATCGFANGRVQVTNYNKYNLLQLWSTSNVYYNFSATGLSEGVQSGDYLLIANSTTCGEQRVPINIPNGNALEFQINLQSLSDCPMMPYITAKVKNIPSNEFNGTINIIMEGYYMDLYYPTYENETRIPIDSLLDVNTQFYYQYTTSIGICEISQQFTTLSHSTPEITYSISHNYTCSQEPNGINGSAIVTLVYDQTVLPNLSVLDYMNTQVVITKGIFAASYGQEYRVMAGNSTCFSDRPVTIKIEYPQPSLEVIKGNQSGSCFDKVDLRFYNFLNYDNINLVSSNVGPIPELRQAVAAKPTSFEVAMDEFGIFRDVPLGYYTLYYSYQGCQILTKEIVVGDMTVIDPKTQTEIVSEVYHNADCSNSNYLNGYVEYNISTPAGYVNGTSYFSTNYYSVYVPITIPNTQCFIQYSFFVSGRSQSSYPYNVTVTPADCQYEKTMVTFSNLQSDTASDYLLYLDDEEYTLFDGANPNEVYALVDNAKNFSDSRLIYQTCPYIFNLSTPVVPTPFTVQYTTTPISDCSTPTGTITLIDWDQYELANITGITTDNGTWLNVPGRYGDTGMSDGHLLTFTRGSCSGSISIPISTTVVPDFKYTVLQNPTCEMTQTPQNSGTDSLVMVTSDTLWISRIFCEYGLISDSDFPRYLKGAPPNITKCQIRSDYCTFPFEMKLDLKKPTFSATPYIPNNCYVNYQVDGYEQNLAPYLITSSPKIEFKVYEIEAYDPITDNLVYNIRDNQTTYVVRWNDVCSDMFELNITNLNGVATKPKYEITQDPCFDFKKTVRVLNHDQYTYLSVNNIQADKDGYVYDVMDKQITINYVDKTTGCSDYIIDFKHDQNITAPYTTEKESCHGSEDGQVIPSANQDREDYKYTLWNIEYDGRFPMIYTEAGNNSFTTVRAGDYSLVRYKASNYACARIINLNVLANEPVMHVDTESSCDGVNSVTGSVKGTTFDLKQVKYNITSPSQMVSTNGDFGDLNGGTYNVAVSIGDSRCPRYMKSTFDVTPATKSSTGSCKKNLGWIAAVVIGALIVGAAIIAFVIYKRKRVGSAVKEIKEVPVEMSTVNVFQGGKITKLDDF